MLVDKASTIITRHARPLVLLQSAGAGWTTTNCLWEQRVDQDGRADLCPQAIAIPDWWIPLEWQHRNTAGGNPSSFCNWNGGDLPIEYGNASTSM